MKKLIITTVVCLFALGISTSAQAVLLDPVTTPSGTPTGAIYDTTGGIVKTVTTPFSTIYYVGSITQDVYLNSTGYLFVYYFTNVSGGSSGANAVMRMTTTDFAGFTTDVDAYKAATTNYMPTEIDRYNVNTVGFDFDTTTKGVPQGGTSAQCWVQTNAQYLGAGAASIIDGKTADVDLYGPAVPEPASMVLFGLGLVGLGGRVVRKRFRA